MSKHYHLTSGLRGGYLPNRDEVYDTKAQAIGEARRLVADYRDNGDKVRGTAYSSTEGDLVGYWIARESGIFAGDFHDYISVRICREPECADLPEWD